MTDIPAAAIAAAESAIRAAFPGEFGKPGMPEPDALARAALEAAAPLLAEAWGAFECEPLRVEAEQPPAAFFDEHDLAVIRQYQECPESHMDDGSHSADYEDDGRCVWCGESNLEVPGE